MTDGNLLSGISDEDDLDDESYAHSSNSLNKSSDYTRSMESLDMELDEEGNSLQHELVTIGEGQYFGAHSLRNNKEG